MRLTTSAAALLVIVAALLNGTNPYFIKSASYDFLGTPWFRHMGIALCVFLLLSVVKDGFSKKKLKLQIVGGLLLGLTQSTWTIALMYTSSANGIALVFFFPVMSALLMWFGRGIPPTRREWCFHAMSLAGIAALLWNGLEFRPQLGDLLAVGSGVFFALYLYAARNLYFDRDLQQRSEQRMRLSLGMTLIGQLIVIVLLSAAMAIKGLPTPPSIQQLMHLLGLGVTAGIVFALYAVTIQKLKAHVQGMLMMIEVPTAVIIGLVILGEGLSWNQMLGCALLLSSAASITLSQKKN